MRMQVQVQVQVRVRVSLLRSLQNYLLVPVLVQSQNHQSRHCLRAPVPIQLLVLSRNRRMHPLLVPLLVLLPVLVLSRNRRMHPLLVPLLVQLPVLSRNRRMHPLKVLLVRSCRRLTLLPVVRSPSC
jgi:hypothetical protein